jgi:hypothetical protein
MGRLLERMGRHSDAESYYLKIAERYDSRDDLRSFHVRRRQRGDASYARAAEEAVAALFPSGLRPVSLAGLDADAWRRGLLVDDSLLTEGLRRFGLERGDVVVALDGWRVENRVQYLCVRSFTDEPGMTAIVWRKEKYQEIAGRFGRRTFGP